jgi:hypothetical protein
MSSSANILSREETDRLRLAANRHFKNNGRAVLGGGVKQANAAVEVPEMSWLYYHPAILRSFRQALGTDAIMFTNHSDVQKNVLNGWHKDERYRRPAIRADWLLLALCLRHGRLSGLQSRGVSRGSWTATIVACGCARARTGSRVTTLDEPSTPRRAVETSSSSTYASRTRGNSRPTSSGQIVRLAGHLPQQQLIDGPSRAPGPCTGRCCGASGNRELPSLRTGETTTTVQFARSNMQRQLADTPAPAPCCLWQSGASS